MKAISRPRIRNQKNRLGGVRLDLLSQAVNEDAKVFQFVSIIGPPYSLQKFPMRNRFVRAREEIGEQSELPRRQTRRSPVDAHFPGRKINVDTLSSQRLQIRLPRKLRQPAQGSADSRQEFRG